LIALACVAVIIYLIIRKRVHREKLSYLILLLFISLAYYYLFISQGWPNPTYRIMFPLYHLLIIACVTGVELVSDDRWSRWIPALGLIVAVSLSPLTIKRSKLSIDFINDTWNQSAELLKVLRGLGMKDSREAFVFNWNRFVTDDPELISYYNCGYWNLMNHKFKSERPNPYHELNDLKKFSTFMKTQNVKFIVISSEHIQVFPRLAPVYNNKVSLSDYIWHHKLGEDVILVRRDLLKK
jgi:hypothetical protein